MKWVDFYRTFWHCDCINRMSPDAFEERYKKWCKRKGYHFSADAADALYAASCGLYTTLPRDNNAKLLVTVATDQLIALRENQSKLETEMLNLCKQLPEYETVMDMYGVGKSTGPHLMAELGDIRRFPHRSSIVAFAGVDPGVVGSGKMQLSMLQLPSVVLRSCERLSFKWFLFTLSANPKTKQFTSSMLKSVMRENLTTFVLPLPQTNSCVSTMPASRSV